MTPNSKLTTIMASDVCGYSKLIGENELAAIVALQECRKIMDPLIQAHGGRIFNTAGDAVLAEFDSPVGAIDFAIKCQNQFHARNKLPGKLTMRWRFGMNLGEVYILDNGDLLGDGINLAARLESIADQGGVAVGAELYGVVHRKIKNVTFEDRGEVELKNISDPIQVWAIKIEGATRTVTAAKKQAPEVKNYAKEIELLERSAARMDGEAAFKLGKIYTDKTSSSFDIEKAINWLWAARGLKIASATDELNRIIPTLPKDKWLQAKTNAEVFLDDLRWKSGAR